MFDAIERGLYWLSSILLEGDSDVHCQLRAPVDDTTFSTTSDDLLTVVEILGARRLIGSTEFEQQAANLGTILARIMKGGNGSQHSFGFGFRSSAESVDRLLGEIFAPSRNTARRFGAESSDLYFTDQMQALARRCAEESAYLVVLTHRTGLSPADMARAAKWREESGTAFRKASGGVELADDFSQSPRTPVPALFARHASAVTSLISGIERDREKEGAEIMVRTLPCAEAVARMRLHHDASGFPSSWRPRLLGDAGASVAADCVRKGEHAHLMPTRIGRQMVAERYTEIFGDAEIAKRGSIYYASVVLDVPPETGSEPFSALAERIGHAVPWSINFEMTPNGTQTRQLDQTYSAFVGAFGEHNKRIRKAWLELKRLRNDGVYVCAIRVVVTTWARSEQQCVENYSFLKSTLESWGSSVVTNETGTPALAALCSAAGFAKRMPAPYVPGPLGEFARMLPVFRPASIWKAGQLICHTAEGRPYPVQFGSLDQAFWGTLIFAPSGSGKSFLMNLINFGILLSPGLEDLPYMVIVDVGPSSRLVMDLVKSMLPPRLARQIQSLRIRNDRQYTVNPWDTQLGCDKPTNVDKDFQVSVLATLCPSLGLEGEKFISMVIDQAYEMFSRTSPTCRVWEPSLDEDTVRAMAQIGFVAHERTRVWDIVDALFDAGRAEDAARAQRYAVPTLKDMLKAARQKVVLDMWETAVAANGREPIIEVFCRSVMSAMSDYKLINGYTQFDIGSARAISVDLEELVTNGDSEESRRRAAMMFLFARRLGAKNFFLRWDEIAPIVPDRYRAYQEQRVKEIYGALKFLEYDEKHYTTGIPSLDRQVQQDLRVGRKYNTVTIMASQQLEDFPPAAVENCYTYFVLGIGTDNAASRVQQTFGLSDSEVHAIKTRCVGPGTMFGLFKTTKGTTSQVLHTAAGPFTQWAFLTSPGDKDIRSEVVEKTSCYHEAIDVLARAFPTGSARREMESYRQKMADGESMGGRTLAQIFADIAIERARAQETEVAAA